MLKRDGEGEGANHRGLVDIDGRREKGETVFFLCRQTAISLCHLIYNVLFMEPVIGKRKVFSIRCGRLRLVLL